MVPGKTNVSLTLSWSTDYDPIAAAQQPGAAKQGSKGDADSEVMLPAPAICLSRHHHTCIYLVYTHRKHQKLASLSGYYDKNFKTHWILTRSQPLVTSG